MMYQGYRGNQNGFSLIELIVVVAIIAMLASIGYPMYKQHVLRGHRAAAAAALLNVASRMETFRLDNKTYNTTDMTSLGFGLDPLYINSEGFEVPQAAAKYKIDVKTASAVNYTLSAIPVNNQTVDTDCAEMTLNNVGVKAATNSGGGASTICWR